MKEKERMKAIQIAEDYTDGGQNMNVNIASSKSITSYIKIVKIIAPENSNSPCGIL